MRKHYFSKLAHTHFFTDVFHMIRHALTVLSHEFHHACCQSSNITSHEESSLRPMDLDCVMVWPNVFTIVKLQVQVQVG